jgi:hypothetical protein
MAGGREGENGDGSYGHIGKARREWMPRTPERSDLRAFAVPNLSNWSEIMSVLQPLSAHPPKIATSLRSQTEAIRSSNRQISSLQLHDS